MKNFDWNAFGKERNKIAVHCKTEEEAIDFCKQSHEHGYDWCSGSSRLEKTNWEFYKKDTCYCSYGYTCKDFYVTERYTILEWSDYMVAVTPETETHMTGEEIFEMLKPKIEKNGIKTNAPTVLNVKSTMLINEYEITNYAEEMKKAIAIAYRSGYGRGQKGRPFKMNTNNQNPDSYFMGHKVIGKKPEVGDRVIMAKKHQAIPYIGHFYPLTGICGEVTEQEEDTFRIKWDSGVRENNLGGWWICPEYIKVIK